MQLIINDRVDVALAVKADGVHLGQDDMPPAAAASLLGHTALIGLSTHNFGTGGSRYRSMPIDYLAIGPDLHDHLKS